MLNVYLKNMKKSWIVGLVGPAVVVMFVGLIGFGFPVMKETILQRLEQMQSPIMKAFLGDLGIEELGFTFEAAMFMYAGGTLNILVLFAAIIVPARLLSTEIDKNTLDVVLSFPISRWRYLVEKFSVYLTYNLLYPTAVAATMIVAAMFVGEPLDYALVVNYSIGIWLQLFALGAISLLCATIFLDSNKALTAAGVLVLGQYIVDSIGGLFDASGTLQYLSLFHYMRIDSIIDAGMLPLGEAFIVIAVGIVALAGALTIFHKREFAI